MSLGSGEHCLCIVTGASRGFGQAIAVSLFQEYGIFGKKPLGSKVVLIARSLDTLQVTYGKIIEVAGADWAGSIDLVPIDYACPDSAADKIKSLFLQLPSSSFARCVIFSNAGALGNVSSWLSDVSDLSDIQSHVTVNVSVPSFLISSFCKATKGMKQLVVNISSLAALEPLPSMGLYCVTKAAMDMFCKALAAELSSCIVLNYAPGPMDTDMARYLRDNSCSEEIRRKFSVMYEDGTIINPNTSAKKLLTLVKNCSFKSGAHIDFYDVE